MSIMNYYFETTIISENWASEKTVMKKNELNSEDTCPTSRQKGLMKIVKGIVLLILGNRFIRLHAES